MTKLWESDSFVDDNTLTVNITRLRKKLEGEGLKDFIITNGNASYFDGISTDSPNAPAVWHDKYQIVHWLYRRYGTDLCTGIWSDLSYDCKIILSYRRTKITT